MQVLSIKPEQAYSWILNKHYAKRIPQIMFAYGLFIEKEIVGVVTYGIPPSPTLCTGICGKEWSDKVLELNRLCLEDNYKNQASFLIANSMKLLPKPRIIVSYADTAMNHIGYVYQATNFIYTGLTIEKAIWKIKGQEEKHSKNISYGISLEEIKSQHGDDFYYDKRSKKHRYVYFLGNKTEKKILRKLLKYDILPYPKGESIRYDATGKVAKQALLF